MQKIAAMTTTDIDFAISMTDHEQWRYLPGDIQRLIDLTPDGCFIARDNNERVGMVTSTVFNDYAFIGTLIVQNKCRGRRIGEALMHHTIDFLQSQNIRTIELDGVFPAVSLYRRLGFQDKYLSLRFKRLPAAIAEEPASKKSPNAAELSRFDLKQTGIDRRNVLNRYSQEFADSLFVHSTGNIAGYAFVRPRAGGIYAIGPFVAADSKAAEAILTNILSVYGDHPIAIGVPQPNLDSVRILLDHGFIFTQPSVRMYLGDKREYQASVYSIISAEKG
jgi:ribosomal protein S18 acetylase RimI-like enzyme